jgi:hypothetical protein
MPLEARIAPTKKSEGAILASKGIFLQANPLFSPFN